MSVDNKMLGSLGEHFAEEYMIQDGFTIEERNYRCRYGEIDLIAQKNTTVYFVEVKTRRSLKFGYPAEAVTRAKKLHMRKAAACFLQERQYRGYSAEFLVFEVFANIMEDAVF